MRIYDQHKGATILLNEQRRYWKEHIDRTNEDKLVKEDSKVVHRLVRQTVTVYQQVKKEKDHENGGESYVLTLKEEKKNKMDKKSGSSLQKERRRRRRRGELKILLERPEYVLYPSVILNIPF